MVMVEKKYLNAVENLVQIEQDEKLSKFDQEVDNFFNYILSLIKKDLERNFNVTSSTIQEVSANESQYDIVVLIRKNKEIYASGVERKDFYKVIDRVTKIYSNIKKINGYVITVKNYTSEYCAELTYDLIK